jgi:hypothetical protein
MWCACYKRKPSVPGVSRWKKENRAACLPAGARAHLIENHCKHDRILIKIAEIIIETPDKPPYATSAFIHRFQE